MATGGIFTLIANEGKQDRMIMATELLNMRLKQIKKIRCKDPTIKDILPTLVDIERTHILFVNAHFKPFVAIGYEYQAIDAQAGTALLGHTVDFSIPQFGDFFHDMVIHAVLTGLEPVSPLDQSVYCDFLGHRLISDAQFLVNENILDEINSDVYNFHYNFFVPDWKKPSWLRGVGQEVPKPAVLTQNPGIDQVRERRLILDGPQTPKSKPPIGAPANSVELWVPLLFWFNVDPRLSIPSVSIPFGQRFIRISLASAADICTGVDYGGGGAIIPPTLTTFQLYINNIFVNPEIHDIFIKRVGFYLIRVHRLESKQVISNSDSILLDQLKWPIETLYFGIRPNINNGTMTDWYKFYLPVDVNYTVPVRVPNTVPPFVPPDQLAFADAVYQQQIPTLTTISWLTHGVELYKITPAQFFNVYVPYNYGGTNIMSPADDLGMYMTTFNLYPGGYQPSGHINLSTTREFYLRYTSDIISLAITGTLVVVGIAINFLLISSGTAVLRYNT